MVTWHVACDMRQFPIKSANILRRCIIAGCVTSGVLVSINAKIAISYYDEEAKTNSDRLLLFLSFFRLVSFLCRLPMLYMMCNSYTWVTAAPNRRIMIDRLINLKDLPIFRVNKTASNVFYICFAIMFAASMVNVRVEGPSWIAILLPWSYSIQYQQSKISSALFNLCLLNGFCIISLTMWCGKCFYDACAPTPIGRDFIDKHSDVIKKGVDQVPEGTFKSSQCAVCYGDFAATDEIRILRCKHMFHRECVDEWLTTQRNSCPMCNKPVVID